MKHKLRRFNLRKAIPNPLAVFLVLCKAAATAVAVMMAAIVLNVFGITAPMWLMLTSLSVLFWLFIAIGLVAMWAVLDRRTSEMFRLSRD